MTESTEEDDVPTILYLIVGVSGRASNILSGLVDFTLHLGEKTC